MTIDLMKILKLIFPKRKGDRLVNAGILFIAASMIGGYGEFHIVPLMQIFGVIAGIMVIIIGACISHERSKYKSSRHRKLV